MAEGISGTFNIETVDRVLATLEALGRDGTPLLREIGLVMVQAARDRLGGTVAPDGQPWPGLVPGYAALRAAMHPQAQGMLRVSGMLAASLTFETGATFLRVGSPLIYAGVHQAGATIFPRNAPALAFPMMGASGHVFLEKRGSVTIPARPYLGLGGAEIAGIEWAWRRTIDLAFAG